MKAMRDKWCAMIDVNSICYHNCTYCCKYTRHLRKDQRWSKSLAELERDISTLLDYPGKIGLTGGDPLNNPDIEGMCDLVKKMLPKHKVVIFTSSPKVKQYKALIDETFGEVYINMHTKAQKEICLHQPLTLAVGDMVPDKEVRDLLIDNCWCGNSWSPIIGRNRAFFCDCADGIDAVLDMKGGFPIEEGWWRRDVREQMEQYCHLCGMCLPYPRQALKDGNEKFSRGLYERFVANGNRNMDKVAVIDEVLTREKIMENLVGWEPWHNRQDRPGGEGPEYVNR